MYGIRRIERAHRDARRLQARPEVAGGGATADAVVDHAYCYAGARFRGESFRELSADLVVGEDIAFEMNVMLGGGDSFEHRAVRCRAVN